ncbi:MAG: hypothetical protein IJ484_09270 [Oscillospiraceae bacterium]|nr:hypothetical protein [Oscillospiraceae bacterium]
MLKILKYEWRRQYKELLVLGGVCLALGALLGLLLGRMTNLTRGVLTAFTDLAGALPAVAVGLLFGWVGLCVAMGVRSVVYTVTAHTGLFGDEGYFWHSLPLPAWQLLAGRGLMAFARMLATLFVIEVSVMAFMGGGLLSNAPLRAALAESGVSITMTSGAFDFGLIDLLNNLLQTAWGVVMIQFAVVAGNQLPEKWRVPGGFVCYFVVMSLAGTLMDWAETSVLSEILVLVITALECVAAFAASCWMVSERLDLK